MDFGYTGKPYDETTNLYNYGYRDYSPQTARFTTVDPIRDGNNWFSYVVNDPVNYVDLWGLETANCGTDADATAGNKRVPVNVEVVVGITTQKHSLLALVGKHAFIMYIDKDDSNNSLMLDASGHYGKGRLSDIVDPSQWREAPITVEGYVDFWNDNENLTAFTVTDLTADEAKTVRDLIWDYPKDNARTLLQCASAVSGVLEQSGLFPKVTQGSTPRGLLNDMEDELANNSVLTITKEVHDMVKSDEWVEANR